MLLLNPDQVDDRRRATAPGRELGALYDSLAAELEPLLRHGFTVPAAKALLSRDGGRCADDGTVLDFDPFSPEDHRCARCGRVHRGEHHHRAWVTWYQLWLAERAVHAATFFTLRGDQRQLRLAQEILREYARRYADYPNVDNVLGPTRLFFSTYLESIWLLQLCVAASAVGEVDAETARMVRERIAEPSRAMIGEFDEGMSNRQVWNNAALIAAAALCGDRAAVEDRINGSSGLAAHLANALLEDGSWYEGENYHQFALRGLWYGVVLAEQQGVTLPPKLVDRFHRAFAVPFATALPDFTMPSRKDSQYAISLRQWRLAELTELGFARTMDPTLGAALARCYEPGHRRHDTGRARSAADVERNGPSGALTRADLGWRALLFATPALGALERRPPRSAHLRAQGYAVFRRDHDVYVGFDYGQSGGGHGHPDRLNLTLYQGATRWLDDMGTGSYVDPSLHWYRSTLAHNAPLLGGRSQPLRDGELLAHDEREGMGWIAARFRWPDTDATCERTLVVAPDYLIDEVRMQDSGAATFELPLHLEAATPTLTLVPRPLAGGDGLEDGFDFVRDAHAANMAAGVPVRLDAVRDGKKVEAQLVCSTDATLFLARAPGQPASSIRSFFLIRAAAPGDIVVRSAIGWTEGLDVEFARESVTVTHRGGERHVHQRRADGWHVDLFAAGARSSIDLGGLVQRSPQVEPDEPQPVSHRLPEGGSLRVDLGREHYRRSELDWAAAGRPSAIVTIARARTFKIVARVRAGDAVFAPADAVNPYDNEHHDTMRAGVQLYLRSGAHRASWMIVPEPGSGVRVRAIEPPVGWETPTGHWTQLSDDTYEVEIDVTPPPALERQPLDLDLIINETTRGRLRRRGQLVLTGANGEWVYLRGDRHDDRRWIRIVAG